jgi:hypothetical protein
MMAQRREARGLKALEKGLDNNLGKGGATPKLSREGKWCGNI